VQQITLRAESTEPGDDAGRWAEAVIDLDAGARLRRLTVGDAHDSVEILAEVSADADPTSSGWGSYPMAPWAGRLRHGRFDHPGAATTLRRNHRDGSGTGGGPISPSIEPIDGELPCAGDELAHAIHGTVFGRRWQVAEQTGATLVVTCSLTDPADPLALDWPHSGTARQRITLGHDSIECELAVQFDDASVPVVIGWHPWFAKPDRLDVDVDAEYEVDDIGLPTGQLIEPSPPPWDTCFASSAPAVLQYDRRLANDVTVTSDCDHLVVYDKPAHATCVEPQSGPPDAVNLAARGAAPRPIEVPDIGQSACHTMTISW